jgi:hypothetical protein
MTADIKLFHQHLSGETVEISETGQGKWTRLIPSFFSRNYETKL